MPNADYDAWLERPYQKACEREERFNEILEKCEAEIWHELANKQKAEGFVYDYEPQLEAEMIAAVAEARKNAMTKRSDPEHVGQIATALMGKLMATISTAFEHKAEAMADKIYDEGEGREYEKD